MLGSSDCVSAHAIIDANEEAHGLNLHHAYRKPLREKPGVCTLLEPALTSLVTWMVSLPRASFHPSSKRHAFHWSFL
jgi:hypothetical protein